MNLNVIIRSLGILVMLLGLSMGVCLLLGEIVVVDREHARRVDYESWTMAIFVTVLSGLIAYAFGKWKLKALGDKRISRREAITVVGLGWMVCSLFAALPHYFCVPGTTYMQAVFEACSGFTTTGSSIFSSVELLPKTTLLWRSSTQWMGGMGILGAFLLIFSGETRGKTLLSFESSIHGADLSSTDLRTAMRRLWQVYSILTVICILGLWTMDMNLFQAINHGMAATSTGGFGTENSSITGFSNATKWWLIVFMTLCGISFPLYIAMWTKRSFNVIKKHEETRWYFTIMVVSSIILAIDHGLGNCNSCFVDNIFNVVAILTTTGFVVGDYEIWPLMSQQVIMLLMVIGGCSGSTAGGLKVSRIMLWLRSLKNEIIRGFRPNVVLKLEMNGKTVQPEVMRSVYVVMAIAAFFFVTGSMAVSILEPEMSAVGCASAVLSCMCNIGPAFAELGPTDSFTYLNSPTLVVLSGLMILGRLEFIAVLVLFSRRLWRKY